MAPAAAPTLSLIVATKGRPRPLEALFASLAAQSYRDFEVVVVDQNSDERVGSPDQEGWPFPVQHLRTPGESGLSCARNNGISVARGRIFLFPDDDCWYPPQFLADALSRMRSVDADVLAGRAADETGRDINGRFAKSFTLIDRGNVFSTGIEWVVFVKRRVVERIGGYDEAIGVGAATPWQACEGQDLMLRAVNANFRCVFDPAIFGHHAELDIRSPGMLAKGRSYARGHGYVLRRHGYSMSAGLGWVARPIVRAGLSLLRGDRALVGYYCNVALGRLEGWRMRVPAAKRPSGPAAVSQRVAATPAQRTVARPGA